MAGNDQQKIGCVGIIAIVVAVGWVIGQFGGSDDGGGNDEPVASLVSPSAVQLVRAMSFCSPEPLQARIRFVIWISNTDSFDAEVSVLPVRYYNDGSDNRSILDLVTATISAGQRQFIDQMFSYNALDHDLIRCGVKVGVEDGSLRAEVPIRLS